MGKQMYRGIDVTEMARKQTPMWIFDIENSAMWWANEQAIILWNASDLDELLLRDFTDMSDSTRTRLQNYLEVFERGEVVEETWTFYPKGEAKQVYTIARGIKLPDGVTGLLMEAFPSSLLKLSHNELRMVEAIRHIDVCVCLFSSEGEFVLMNPSAMRVFLTPERQKPSLRELFCDDDEAGELLRLFGETGDVYAEARLRTAVGDRTHALHIRQSKDPINSNDVILFDSKDITERVRLTRLLERERETLSQRVAARTHELQETNQALHLAVQARDRFLASMSHELRTPLNAIIGYSEMLVEEEEESPLQGEQGQWVQNILDSAAHLLSLVEDVLDLSSLMSEHELELKLTRRPLRELCQSCVRKIHPMAKKKALDLEVSLPDEPMPAMVDERRFKQIVLNLLVNAVKYTPAERRIGLRLTASAPTQEYIIAVWDEGVGIAPEDQKALFEPFKQLRREDGKVNDGVGLGLALARQMVMLLGGRIEVESTPGKGSCFRIYVPMPSTEPS